MNDTELKVFKRLPFGKSHFTNYFRLHPVREISTSNDVIVLSVGRNKFQYKWTEIVGARVITLNVTEPSHPWRGWSRTRRLFVLQAPDRSFKFDVSSWTGEFQRGKELFDELQAHIDVKEEFRIQLLDKYKWLNWGIFVVILLLIPFGGVLILLGIIIFLCWTLILPSVSLPAHQ